MENSTNQEPTSPQPIPESSPTPAPENSVQSTADILTQSETQPEAQPTPEEVHKDNKKVLKIVLLVVGISLLPVIALVVLMTGVALPGMQTAQADTQRRQDYAYISAGITNYMTEHSGKLPPTGTFDATQLTARPLIDPSGTAYSTKVIACDSSSPNCGVPTQLKTGEIYIVTGATCDEQLTAHKSKRSFAVYGYLASGTHTYCLASDSSSSNYSTPSTTPSASKQISISWYDLGIPGNNYTVKIDTVTGAYTLKDQPGCSTTECLDGTYYPSPKEYSGTYSTTDLTKILAAYNVLNFDPEASYSYEDYDDFEKKDSWVSAVFHLINPDGIYYECSGKSDSFCTADADGDGVVTKREHAYALLAEITQ
ncbi:hypothetical protein IKF74_00470 [Candidatus Saccharibacteria bacterium]|nr:hypothetical protein [Candidatus Saccharibacteria bacterium]